MSPASSEAAGATGQPSHRLHAFVDGVVQGVGFRYFVLDAARRLGARGWVRNLRDGRVELLAEGNQASLSALLSEVRRGPPGGRVNSVETIWKEAGGEFDGFRLERTA